MRLLKTPVYSLCFGLLLLSLNSCSVDDKKTKLEFSLEAGKTYNNEITRNVKNYELSEGSIKETDENLSVGYSFVPERISPDGVTTLEGKIISVSIRRRDQSGSLEFISADSLQQIPLLAQPYAELTGKTFRMKIDKDGSVKELTGMKENLKVITDNFRVNEPSIRESISAALNEEFGDETMIETFERMFSFYPSEAVEIGQTWKKQVRLKAAVPLIIDHEYKLTERNNGVSVIEVNSEISTDTLNTSLRFSGSQKGKLQIDEISGWISRAVFNYQVHEDESASASKNSGDRLISSEINVSYAPLAGDTFREIAFDPDAVVKGDGMGMTVVGMGVVFVSLVLLFIVFTNLSRLLKINFRRNKEEAKGESGQPVREDQMTGEVGAAIATALHLYFREIHDDESTVLTIKKVARTYSPWSSKIYGLRQYPK